MSNFNDELISNRAKMHHRTVKRLREENKTKEQQIELWKADQGLKPTAKDFEKMIGGAVKSEAEISREATRIADQKAQEQQKLEKSGLIEGVTDRRKDQQTRRTMDDAMREQLGDDKVSEIQKRTRKRARKRKRDGGRELEP